VGFQHYWVYNTKKRCYHSTMIEDYWRYELDNPGELKIGSKLFWITRQFIKVLFVEISNRQ